MTDRSRAEPRGRPLPKGSSRGQLLRVRAPLSFSEPTSGPCWEESLPGPRHDPAIGPHSASAGAQVLVWQIGAPYAPERSLGRRAACRADLTIPRTTSARPTGTRTNAVHHTARPMKINMMPPTRSAEPPMNPARFTSDSGRRRCQNFWWSCQRSGGIV